MTEKLSDLNEVLYRQVHPKQFENGVPASVTFKPSPKDENQLSVDRSQVCTARQSFDNYSKQGYASAAVFGVSVGDFRSENISCVSDPILQNETTAGNPAHALADYSAHSDKQQKNLAKRLKLKAIARGCVYKPE